MLILELTTPERVVLKENCDAATIPTQEGEITVLSGHIPLVANLVPGMVTVRKGNVESYIAVSGGFVEVMPNSRVVLLADTAERAEELDLAKIEAAHAAAEKLLTEGRHADNVSAAAAMAGMEREFARLRVARKHRTRNVPNHPPSNNS